MLEAQFLPTNRGPWLGGSLAGRLLVHRRDRPSSFPHFGAVENKVALKLRLLFTKRGCRGFCGGVPPPTCLRRLPLTLFEVHALSSLHFIQALDSTPCGDRDGTRSFFLSEHVCISSKQLVRGSLIPTFHECARFHGVKGCP